MLQQRVDLEARKMVVYLSNCGLTEQYRVVLELSIVVQVPRAEQCIHRQRTIDGWNATHGLNGIGALLECRCAAAGTAQIATS